MARSESTAPPGGEKAAHARRGMNNRGPSPDAHTFAACRRRSMAASRPEQPAEAELAASVYRRTPQSRPTWSAGTPHSVHHGHCDKVTAPRRPSDQAAQAGGQRRDYLTLLRPVRAPRAHRGRQGRSQLGHVHAAHSDTSEASTQTLLAHIGCAAHPPAPRRSAGWQAGSR